MKQKYEGKDLQGLVDLGREQGYLTFEQVNSTGVRRSHHFVSVNVSKATLMHD